MPSDNRAHERGKRQHLHFNGVRGIKEGGQNLPPSPVALWMLLEPEHMLCPMPQEKRGNPRQVDLWALSQLQDSISSEEVVKSALVKGLSL